jgi:hypothetical protein
VVRCTLRLTRLHHPSNWAWKSSTFANDSPGKKFVLRNRCERTSTPLAGRHPARG